MLLLMAAGSLKEVLGDLSTLHRVKSSCNCDSNSDNDVQHPDDE